MDSLLKNPRGNPRVIFGRGKHEEIREDFQIPRGIPRGLIL